MVIKGQIDYYDTPKCAMSRAIEFAYPIEVRVIDLYEMISANQIVERLFLLLQIDHDNHFAVRVSLLQ